MKLTILAVFAAALLSARASAVEYQAVPGWPKLPEGRTHIGDMHGDVAVNSKGEVFISVMDPLAGLQVYAPDGRFLGNVPNAPDDLHGFVIRQLADGEYIFGARLNDQSVIKMTLDGKVVLTISGSAIPDIFKSKNKAGKLSLSLTAVDVAPNGDIYVTDGYGIDFVHRFDRTGKYLASYGGRNPPYGFKTLHKIVIDTRFTPARILACDRSNKRLVHLSLDGEFLGVVASDLLEPAAVAIRGDYAAVAEFKGRVTLLDKEGKVVTRFGTNTEPGVGTNQVKPEQWRPGFLLSPHGIAFNKEGDIFVSEWSFYGRVQRFNLQ